MTTEWPATTSVSQQWLPTSSLGAHYGATYEASVPASIAEAIPVLSAEVAGLANEASRELARLDVEIGPRIAQFAPLLLRTEAVASSQIEMLTASARSLLTAEAGGKAGRNADAVVANVRAMETAVLLADDITASGILSMHEVLLQGQSRFTPGQWRDEPVWIGTSSESPRGAEFVAPPSERVPELIDDLVQFSRRRDLDAFAKVAIAHAQFETIHPFSDGNGRTGRALAQSMLRNTGITQSVAIPVSAGLLADVHGYHRGLTEYRAGNPDEIVRLFAHAASRAVANARQLVQEISDARDRWNDAVSARADSGVWGLMDVLTARPVLSAGAAAAAIGVQRPNVYPMLRVLEDAGVVQSKREHGLRDSLWRADDILTALDAFAGRAGRRSLGR